MLKRLIIKGSQLQNWEKLEINSAPDISKNSNPLKSSDVYESTEQKLLPREPRHRWGDNRRIPVACTHCSLSKACGTNPLYI
ncbi:hypothetical protein FKM82_008523 [Ascaphus truei]